MKFRNILYQILKCSFGLIYIVLKFKKKQSLFAHGHTTLRTHKGMPTRSTAEAVTDEEQVFVGAQPD